MPNTFNTSFASAAAGAGAGAGAGADSMSRRDGNGSEWSRNRVNGTQTFRRPSTQSRDNLNAAATAPTPTTTAPTGTYIPPHLQPQNSARNGAHLDSRYSRDQLLDIYRQKQEDGSLADIRKVFAGHWDPTSPPSARSDSKDLGADACWVGAPEVVPLGLVAMDEEEKQRFATSVNSPIKLNNPKDGQSTAPGGRKTSLSMVSTTGASRPGTRRRETSDSFANGPLSPTTEKQPFRSEPSTSTPPPALLRRRTDYQDEQQEKEESRPQSEIISPFGSLRRTGTGGAPPSAGHNPPSASPWSAGPSAPFGAGAFANLSSDSQAAQDSLSQRPGFGSARSTSRFKDMMKPSDDMSPSVREKSSFTGLEKLPEEDDLSQSRLRDHVRNRPNRSETNPYDDGTPGRTGSAALNDDPDAMAQMGFNPYATSGGMHTAQTPHHSRFAHDPTSPTDTNPYLSPQGGRLHDPENQQPPAGMQPFGRRDVFAGNEHRGQNSFGSLRGMGSLSGIGAVGNWTNPGFGSGTPGRERPPVSAAFPNSVFTPIGDLQSPGAFGGGSFFAPGSADPNRQSKLGLPFPPAMQDQMRSDSRNDAFDARPDPFGAPPRQDSFRPGYEDMRGPEDEMFGQAPVNHTPPGLPGRSGSGPPPAESAESNSPNSQIPTAQQRQMVMPDRMRWVYRDTAGRIQGPWSGLEMHDWFKAGFFTAELQVKKLEDVDYEPLAQLVRRIGNSREPFLVPQIGVPHGPPTAAGGNPWAAGPSTTAQPPFASAFPSFGTTLTAEQQNALERRKQEEQYLMARQKEFLAQRQGQMHGQNAPPGQNMHALQHHSSAHSLHSQPSFGSMTSPPPAGYQPSPMQAPIGQPSQHTSAFQNVPTPSSLREQGERDDLPAVFGRMGMDSRGPYSNVNQQSFAQHERNRLSMEQQLTHESTFLGLQGRNERLEEFHELRQDLGDDELEEDVLPAPIGSQRPSEEVATLKQAPAPIGAPSRKPVEESEPLSLAQQVQRTAAAHKQAAEEKFIIEPPPVSISPLPAPAAQRSRPQTVAEQLAEESRSTTQTPVETPSATVAPWADKTAEIPKGPSLKETMAAEAKRAAKEEALRQQQVREQLEAEQKRILAASIVPPAPGLPLTSTWAASGSPGTPTTPGGSVWAKPVVSKATSGSAQKKTLDQIQKEEQARKLRTASQTAVNVSAASNPGTALPAGSRYAQMASKATAPQQTGPTPVHAHTMSAGGAWTTVGASGKPKTPATVVASPSVQRTVSTSTLPMSRPTLTPSRSTSIAVNNSQNQAKEELIKWAKSTMGSALRATIKPDTFVQTLYELGTDADLLAEVIYGASDTLDGRRMAEEFIRRRKLADKGVVEPDVKPSSTEAKTSNGGWNEVAKKGPAAPAKEESTAPAGFKVVSKKKGKR